MSKFCLVVSDLEARNVGFQLGEQRHKEQLVQVGLKGSKKKTDAATPRDSKSDEDGWKVLTNWKKTFEFHFDKDKLQGSDKLNIKIPQKGTFFDKLLGKAELSLVDVVIGEERQYEVSLRDGNDQQMEAMFKCTIHYRSEQEVGNGKVTPPSKPSQDMQQLHKPSPLQPMETLGVEIRPHIVKKTQTFPDKALDFQIRVKVIEARELEGDNIKPVARVSIGEEKKQTRVQHMTNRPYFNQTFAFNFTSIKYQDLFNEEINFEIFDSRRFRSDALVGFYKCDVRDIYELEGHILLRKWIMLAEPEESRRIVQGENVFQRSNQTSGVEGAPAGFLKVSMVVVEAGKPAQSLDDLGRHSGTDEDDYQHNLLQLPGVSLIPAVFSLKVFRAEDLPQMDPKNIFNRKAKDWVDPYCIFSFAGQKAKSVIKYDSKNPDFSQQLNIPFQFPSMCDKLKIQLMDWDSGSKDDHIGAVYLSLPSISGDGSTGFLPTFGPCYVNLYGSPREFSHLSNKHDELNKGIGEGAAYRGRVLVQLETKLNAKSGSETEPIFPADIVTVQPYRRRQKFRLLASFLEATMLAVEDSPVEFEMSIGNYGNKLDDTMNPVPSSTPPTNPVFDGEKYYYLPWANSKPYVRINCQWEDITFRLGPLNKLLRICQRLKENIKGIKLTAKVTGLGSDYNNVVCQTLDQLIRDCNPLPELDQEKFKITRLDMHLFKTRKTLLESIAKECKELKSKPDNAETLPTIEGFLERIQKVAVEPQNSMPDVIIWMLKGGTQRIAYYRIPAYEVLYNPDDDQRGVHCGKIIDVNLKYPGKKGANETKFPALLRVMVWLGLEEHQGEWDELEKTGGELSVYAETYENQTSWLVDWSSKNMTRPSFSDANGTRSLPKNAFKEPIGWQFVTDDWKIRPELSSQYAKDSGCKWFLEDAFENEHRYMPGGMWQRNDSLAWTDIYGEVLLDEREKPIKSKDDIMPPKGWQWSEETWRVDKDRAVDHDGWEYTTETSFGLTNYESAERTIHFSRRRRWIRERKNVNGSKAEAPEPPNKEGWEYAISFSTRFHTKRRAFDMVRRRRLQRKLKRTMPGAPEPIFTIKKDKESVLIPPSIFLFFREPHLCELRAYIYQGRNLKPSDPDGLADPYIQLSFGTRSATSKTIHKKLNPTWDQMLVLENVPIYGHYDQISENPPDVTLELFDRDPVGKNYMGRVRVEPTVLLPNEIPASGTKLSWRQVCHGPNSCGDVLAAFELFMDSDIAVPPLPSVDDHGLYPIPRHISPKMQKAVVEVLCWGLRNLARYRWMRVKSPSVEIEIGDKILETSVIRNMKANPNFKETPVLCFNVDLPRDVIYTPPITMRLRSNGSYGHPIIGVCVIENLQEYHRDEVYCPLGKNEKNETGTSKPSQAVVTVEQETPAPSERKESILESLIDKDDHEESFDWWSKYYASRNILDRQGHGGDYPKHYDKIKIYPRALEQEFNFEDFIKTFYFRRGEADSSDDFDADSIVGEFKGSLSIYNPPEGSNDSLPPKVFTEERLRHLRPAPCLIRVYIIRAYGLTAKDRNGLADPYLVVSLGSKTFNDKDSYAAETLDVQFGKVFEFHAVIPVVKNLNIKVMDHDPYSPHDLIGETQIDLESRLLSRRHAIAGLPDSYNTSGPNKWRLGEKYTPSVILSNFCKENDMEPPRFLDSNKQVVLKSRHDEQIFTIDQFRDKPTDPRHAGPRMERLALHVLREKLQLVPEHVETRDLMNSLHPSFPQGKLEMFVDIIPDCNGHPGPRVNIAPRKPKKYELRVIVWNTKDVLLDDKSVLGEEMSDIFVKCKLNGVHDFQKTDVHYRSLNGDGMFNWRMIFPFEYSETNKKIVVMKKAHLWSRREFRDELAPELIVEIWDNDLVSFNDFIGSVTLNLHELSEPFARSKEIKDHHCKEKKGSLFRKGNVRGWWPVTGKKRKKKKSKYKKKDNYYEQGLTGKVELTIELLEDKEAAAKPVGKGQDKPNQHPVLLKPQRPETSFLWIINPWKSFRYIFWHHYKWYFIGLIVLVLLILLIALFIYSAPGYSVKKLFNA